MAKFKVLGGQLSESAILVRSKVRGKLDDGETVTAIRTGFGLEVTTKWGSQMFSDTDPPWLQNVEEITEVTEDNAVNISGAAGWAIVGGVLTGGVGALAGALLGGRGKTITFAIRLKDGSQFLCSGKAKDYAQLLATTGQF